MVPIWFPALTPCAEQALADPEQLCTAKELGMSAEVVEELACIYLVAEEEVPELWLKTLRHVGDGEQAYHQLRNRLARRACDSSELVGDLDGDGLPDRVIGGEIVFGGLSGSERVASMSAAMALARACRPCWM